MKHKTILFCFIGGFIILGLIILILFYPRLQLTLNGNSKIEINVNDSYQEEGATACYNKIIEKCQKLENIEIEGTVDTKTLGKYTVTYKISHKGNTRKAVRIVNVVDKEAPTINGDIPNPIFACPNQTEILIPVTALDNYDGDISGKIIKRLEENRWYLEVSDSSNNITKKEYPVEYKDNEKPTITLLGDQTVYILKENLYKENGYTVLDNCDGDITSKVTIHNPVNTSVSGTYTITYSVSDESGNKAEATRTVKVFEKNSTIIPDGRTIYLTFDDGPGYYTGELLDILKQYNVKATFFVTNQFSKYQHYIKRAYEEGHAIGIHTYSHVYRDVYASSDAYFRDLNQIQEVIKKQTGEETKLIRFPGGSSNTASKFNPGIMTYLTQEVLARGYQYFDWNVGSSDTGGGSPSTIANNVIRSLGNGSTYVVLQHDIIANSVQSVRKIIEYGLANGYQFAPLTIHSPGVHHGVNN